MGDADKEGKRERREGKRSRNGDGVRLVSERWGIYSFSRDSGFRLLDWRTKSADNARTRVSVSRINKGSHDWKRSLHAFEPPKETRVFLCGYPVIRQTGNGWAPFDSLAVRLVWVQPLRG